MQISVLCKCGKTIRTRAEYVGRKAKCPACGDVFTIAHAPELTPNDWKNDGWSPPDPLDDSPSSTPLHTPPPFPQSAVSPTLQAATISAAAPVTTRPTRQLNVRPALFIGTAAVGFMGLILILLVWAIPTKWEYRSISVRAKLTSDAGITSSNFSHTTIPECVDRLNSIGADGWELVGVALETETVYPNFGKGEYVTGLQPNIRPQMLNCYFKRRTWFWR